MKIRIYHPNDCIQMMQLFFDVVRTGSAEEYPIAQLEDWATAEADIAAWAKSFKEHYTVVAENDEGTVVGFGDLNPNGYFDRLFVHRDYHRRGIATQIADELERFASQHAIAVVFTQSCAVSRPFFEGRGYRVMKTRSVEDHGATFDNFIMRKIVCD